MRRPRAGSGTCLHADAGRATQARHVDPMVGQRGGNGAQVALPVVPFWRDVASARLGES